VTGPRTGFEPETVAKLKALFCRVMAQCGHVAQSAKAAGIHKSTVYTWRLADEDFAVKWKAAKATYELGLINELEIEARRRAVDGIVRPIFYRGKEVGVIREFSDRLLVFLLGGLDPRYREQNHKVDKSVHSTQTIEHKDATGDLDYSRLTTDELQELRRLAGKARPPAERSEDGAGDRPPRPSELH